MSDIKVVDTGLERTIEILPILADKFVVDFANSIHVNNDHIRVQKQRTGFGARLLDSFTGQGKKRQNEINANLNLGVESSLKWLGELSESLAQSNYAITSVNNRLNALKHDVAKIANYSADTRQLLHTLSIRMCERCDGLEQEIARIDSKQRALTNLESIFSKWEAGRYYQELSLASRSYLALEELNWGAFGDFYRASNSKEDTQELVDIAKNKLISRLINDTSSSSTTRLDAQQWLTSPKSSTAHTLQEAVAYIGDSSNEIKQPLIYSASQQPKSLPLGMPCLLSADRLSEALLNEVFEEKKND